MSTQTNQAQMSFTGSVPQVPAARSFSGSVSYIVLGIVFLLAVGFCIYFIMLNTKHAREKAANELAAFQEEQHLLAEPVKEVQRPGAKNDAVNAEEESVVSFSLYTTPQGAEVYRNGEWIGDSDLEDIEFKRSEEEESWIIYAPGYELKRYMFVPNGEIPSETIELEKTVVVPTANKPAKTEPEKGAPKVVDIGVLID